jgi:hypothetical protein
VPASLGPVLHGGRSALACLLLFTAIFVAVPL